MTEHTSPFHKYAGAYIARGWFPFPLPYKEKEPPPGGVIGYEGRWPTKGTIAEWRITRSAPANIGLRLPADVLGIDVDCYDGKKGSSTLFDAEMELGPLPGTYQLTSREDGSHKAFYRVPKGRRWKGQLGPGVDILSWYQRYTLAAPSLHPSGDTVTWFVRAAGSTGAVPCKMLVGPRPEDLPHLPDAWVAALDKGPASERTAKRGTGPRQVHEFLATLPEGPMCPVVTGKLAEWVDRLSGGRHDNARGGILALLTVANWGHRGGADALEQLHDAFLTAAGDGKRTGDPEAEWGRMVVGAVALLEPCGQRRCCGQAPPGGALWEASDQLAELAQLAHSRLLAPEAMLGCVLAIVAASVGPHVVLPPTVGAKASLNLFVGLVAPSGGGKSSAVETTREYLQLDDDRVPVHEVGTGQGVTSAYCRPPKPNAPVQFCDTALWLIDEIGSLAAHARMGGANVVPILKSAYSGAQLGARYADEERRRPVKAHRYRAAVVAGIQPAHARVILDDVDGGFPQRWLWLPAGLSGGIVEVEPPLMPGGWSPRPQLAAQGVDEAGVVRSEEFAVQVCELARAEVVEARKQAARGQGDPMAAHRNLTRLKVAALLGIWHGRAEIGTWEWETSELVMTISDATRKTCELAVASTARRSNRAKAVMEAERAVVVEEKTNERAMTLAVRQAVRRVTAHHGEHPEGSCPRRCVTQAIASRYRQLVSVDEVIARAVAEDRLTDAGDGRYRPGGEQ